MSLEATIATNLSVVRARIESAARSVSRQPDEVRLVAVSKTFGLEHVRAAAAAGQVDFGENRVQEAMGKIAQASDLNIQWHLVGHLQTNKAGHAAASFAYIHSVDRQTLLERLDRAASEHQASPLVLIQVNLAGEATKSGVAPADVRALFDAGAACQAIRVVGLMTLPPFSDRPEDARCYFRALRELRDDLVRTHPREMLAELSMGMSHDLEVAVQEGATMVRVGTAIFGRRPSAV